MLIIEELKLKYRNAIDNGLRPAAVKLSGVDQVLLVQQVSEDPMIAQGSMGISLFMGIPVIDGLDHERTVVTVNPDETLVSLERPGVVGDRRFDIFDLDSCEWNGILFGSKDEADQQIARIMQDRQQ